MELQLPHSQKYFLRISRHFQQLLDLVIACRLVGLEFEVICRRPLVKEHMATIGAKKEPIEEQILVEEHKAIDSEKEP